MNDNVLYHSLIGLASGERFEATCSTNHQSELLNTAALLASNHSVLRRAMISQAPYGVNDLHLCDAAAHKQFRPRDVAAVIGSEKNDGPGDLIGRAEPAERNAGENPGCR
jgi:hypothetical protein